MANSTIYDMRTGNVLTEGVQSQAVCNATINTARSIARDRRASVVVVDWGTRDIYRVTPSGLIWRAPAGWDAPWGAE